MDAVEIDFNDIAIAGEASDTYADLGVTFSSPAVAESFYASYFGHPAGDVQVCNFPPFQGSYPDIAVVFAARTYAAGFQIITNDPDDTNIHVYLFADGSFVGTGTVTFDTSIFGGATFVGVQDPDGFDAIVIDVQDNINGAMCIDDFIFESITDSDGDGVDDPDDLCPDTPEGDLVNDDGCNGGQYIALTCDAGSFRNHGQYVRCVAHAANAAANDGLIEKNEKGGYVSEAAKNK